MFSLSAVLNQMRSLFDHLINVRLAHTVQTDIMNKTITLDMHFFENAAFYDKLQSAQQEVNWRPVSIVNSSFLIVQDLLSLVSLLVLLLNFGPIVLLLLVASIPSFIAQMRYSTLYFRLLTWHAPEFRRKLYWEHLLTQDTSMKEIKLFGLGKPLLQRYSEQFWKFYGEDAALAQRRTLASVLWGLLATACYYSAYAWTVYRTLQGAITLGDLTLYLAVLRQAQGSFQGLFNSIGQIYEGSLFMTNLFNFLKLEPEKSPTHKEAKPMPPTIKHGIEFRDVWFKYPEQEEWALQ
jgi:ATP-binding cassette subfamily B protein